MPLVAGPVIAEVAPELMDIDDDLKEAKISNVDGTTSLSHKAGSFRGRMPLTQDAAPAVRNKRPLPRPRGSVASSSSHEVDLGWF